MKDSLKNKILMGNFDQAENIARKLSSKELYDELMEIAFDNQNILSYVFINHLITEKETAEYHSLASDLLALPLCSLNGGYQAALFHARKALELDPHNIEYKEWIIFFHGIPDHLVSLEEAQTLAREILKDKPESSAALEVLE